MNSNEKLFVVNGYELDEEQKKVVTDESKNLLVVASAGSGKSLTIIGKIKYLIENKKINSKNILCISFTNDACNSLKHNINKNYNYNIEVYTFHKLALNILKKYNINISIAPSDLLEYIIEEYFESIILDDYFYMSVVLKYFKVKTINIKKEYTNLLSTKKLNSLKNLISKFIHLFKANDYDFSYLENILTKEKNKIMSIFYKNNIYFLLLSLKIMYEYQEELNSQKLVDFDDMIKLATITLENGKQKIFYKHIFIDEFQDTSILRYKLISTIIKMTNANLTVVGDDYQSIYRFSGCDLSLFLNFKQYQKNSRILKIQTTYRNSINLNEVANKFIRKNSIQINKKTKSNKNLSKPIKIIYYTNMKTTFKQLLDFLYASNKKSILILGRNNNEINKVIDNNFTLKEDGSLIYNKYQDMKLRFLTIHKSKGLEDDNVIVLSLEDDVYAFPNKKEDDKILTYVTPKKENFLYAEERRLFYVSLTRTKNYVYLLTNKNKPSIFVKEILKDSKKHIEIINI